MNKLPYIIISTAMSLDGFIDDTNDKRLVISNEKDIDRVNELRDSCDAILVGANTVRKDNPKLLSKTGKRLIKVTITSSDNLDPSSLFFTTGNSEKIVYAVSSHVENLREKLASVATVVDCGEMLDLRFVLEDLSHRGVKRLMVEGGSTVLTQFLQKGFVNELHLAIAGFYVGQKDAPRFVNEGRFPWNENNRLQLVSVGALDGIAVLVYKNSLLSSPLFESEH